MPRWRRRRLRKNKKQTPARQPSQPESYFSIQYDDGRKIRYDFNFDVRFAPGVDASPDDLKSIQMFSMSVTFKKCDTCGAVWDLEKETHSKETCDSNVTNHVMTE